ncbi:MAG: hypothetical protein IPM52_13360 [Bacteroidetes bacterium]|nr:hypothetical protein [Bacteroidota bacterium]
MSKPELCGGHSPILSQAAYNKMVQRQRKLRLRRGSPAGPALLAWDMLRDDVRRAYTERYGDPRQNGMEQALQALLKPDAQAIDYFANYRLNDGRALPPKNVAEYVANAQMLDVLARVSTQSVQFIKALNGNNRQLWPNLAAAVARLAPQTGHNLPENPARLRQKVMAWAQATGNDRYAMLVPNKYGNDNARKLRQQEQESLLRQLLRKHQNFDNEQVRTMYNIVAEKLGWYKLSAQTIANYREKWNLHTIPGRKGEQAFDNTKAMLVKRSRPTRAMLYWTVDGWEAELLYQSQSLNSKGLTTTTYHNRPTIVVVLDPSVRYPVGYAIGTHETPALIRQALRNAVQHTKALFGQYYKVLQLQSDRYGGGELKSLYEFVAEKYTPARAHNSKAKAIEPWFGWINKKYCQLMPNWSGVGVARGSQRQPNAEYLNKIRHSFPDFEGARKQLEQIVEAERARLRDDYLQAWNALAEAERRPMSIDEYLMVFGETTGYVNSLSPMGIVATIEGQEMVFDSFDARLRQLQGVQWCIKYDPANTSQVLALSAKGHNGRLVEADGQHRIMLEKKHVQPMALHERAEGDVHELQRIAAFNRNLKQDIMRVSADDYQHTLTLFERHPELSDTLTKLVLVDSRGQHKDRRNQRHVQAAAAKAQKLQQKEQDQIGKTWTEQQEQWLDAKIDLQRYIQQENQQP